MKIVTLPLAFLFVVLWSPLSQAQTRGATAEDYYAFETLADVRMSPDG